MNYCDETRANYDALCIYKRQLHALLDGPEGPYSNRIENVQDICEPISRIFGNQVSTKPGYFGSRPA